MYCPKCGLSNPEQATSCANCGSSLPITIPNYALLTPLKVGFLLRLGAGVIDTIIVSVMSFFVIVIPLIGWLGSQWGKYGQALTQVCSANDTKGCEAAILNALSVEIVGFVIVMSVVGGIAFLLSLTYYVVLTARGATLGKKAFGLRVVKGDGSAPGFLTALLRQTIGYALSGYIFGLGFLWIAFDLEKQGWHDKIARTYVVQQH